MFAFYNFINKHISSNEPAPLYKKLDQAVRQSIKVGILAPGDYLPSERVLMKELNVSRKTVRHAFEQLRDDKLIDSTQGLGTFVTRKINYDIKGESGFSDIVARLGGVPSTQWLLHEKVAASDEVAEKLHLKAGTEVYQFKRLRFIDGQAVSIEDSYVRHDRISDIDLTGDSLYQFFQENNIRISQKKSYISARLPGDEAKELLDIDKDCPLLIIRQQVFSADSETPFEYSVVQCRSDAYEFAFED